MTIGEKISELRRNAGLTQRDLALKIGVTPSAVGNYEQGVSFPREEVLYRLFEALDCSPNELFGFEEETVTIAARKGGGTIVLKKRGKKSIFDAPDYR
ncbi:MAG: helix-turn-helix domain-containing protein [Oscillospiraceae bacterium]|nr:helix-turn-helix domain-containing protein [Oscillospiraceae bacterium]